MRTRAPWRTPLLAAVVFIVLAVSAPAALASAPTAAGSAPTTVAIGPPPMDASTEVDAKGATDASIRMDGTALSGLTQAGACTGGDDGAVFATDSGLAVTYPGKSLSDNPFHNETTLAFENVTVGAQDDASVQIATATDRRLCLTAANPENAALVVTPSAGPRLVVRDRFDSLAYGAIGYASDGDTDLSYSAPSAATVTIMDSGLRPNHTVSVVDSGSGVVLTERNLTEDRRATVTLPAGERTVDFQLTAIETPNGTDNGSVGDGPGPGGIGPGTGGEPTAMPPTQTPTPTPTPVAADDGGGWVGELVEYQPTAETSHVGGFFPVALLLWIAALALLYRYRDSTTRLFALVLVFGSLRATSDLLVVTLEGFAGFEASIAGLNLLLEFAISLSFARFALAFADTDLWQRRPVRWGMGALAGTGTAAILSNPVHGLMFSEVGVASEPFTYISTTSGPGGLVLFALNSALLAGATVLIMRSLLDVSIRSVWRPVGVVGVGLFLAVLAGALSVVGLGPVSGFDYTAAGVNYFLVATTGTLLAHGLQRVRTSGQKSVVFDLDDAIVILDHAWTVVESNPAAERLFSDIDGGTPFEDVLAEPLPRPAAGNTDTQEIRISAAALADSGESTDSADSAESTDSVDSAESTDSADSGESTDSADSADSGESTDSVDSAESIDSTASADAAASADAEDSSDHSTGGGYRHFLASVTTVSTGTNTTIGYAVRLADITPIKRRMATLEEKNEQLDRFASAITQDLRSPLEKAEQSTEAAAGLVEQAGGRADVARPKLRTHLTTIGDGLERMGGVIEDVLGLARDGGFETESSQVSLERIAASASDSVEDVTVRVASSAQFPADPDNLRRMLEHLYRNAVEHGRTPDRPSETPDDHVEAGPNVTVTVGIENDGFYVADDGPGVAATICDDLFEEGATTKGNGTGLGLAIVRRRAHAQGWQVHLDPDAGGARFVVTGVGIQPEDVNQGNSRGDPAVDSGDDAWEGLDQ